MHNSRHVLSLNSSSFDIFCFLFFIFKMQFSNITLSVFLCLCFVLRKASVPCFKLIY